MYIKIAAIAEQIKKEIDNVDWCGGNEVIALKMFWEASEKRRQELLQQKRESLRAEGKTEEEIETFFDYDSAMAELSEWDFEKENELITKVMTHAIDFLVQEEKASSREEELT